MTVTLDNQPMRVRPRIGLTIGDPAGIGPEVSLKAAWAAEVLDVCLPVLIGDASYLAHWARRLGLRCDFKVIKPGEAFLAEAGVPLVYDLNNISGTLLMGQEQAAAGQAAAQYIETAVGLCQAGELAAMTTAPINKKSLHLAGYAFPGHTEYLAHLTHTDDFAMAFISPQLRVVLLTTHVPLMDVARYVKQDALKNLIRLTDREFKRFGFAHPRIAVAANPHGAEGGLFGVEEAAEMLPAIEACQIQEGLDVSGPHSGDTVFLRAARGEFDVVLSCYHDQGLIPIKCMAFGEAVNVTLGLPFIRTSVDHGTAFDIAGQGLADPSSMCVAIQLAADLTQRRQAAALQP